MPPREDIMKWWKSFTTQAFELGYDFKNPSDRSLIKYVVKPEELKEYDKNIEENVLVDAFISTDEDPLREYDYHPLDWYLDNQAEPDDEHIAKLYQKAMSHELLLINHTTDPAKNDLDSCRAINIDRDGNAHISKTVGELDYSSKTLEETQRILNDEFAPVAGNPMDIMTHFAGFRGYIVNGDEHKPRGKMSLEEYREMTDSPDATEIQFFELYNARSVNNLAQHDYFKPLGSVPNVPKADQLQALTDTSHGVTKLEEIVAAEQGVNVESFAGDRHNYNFQFYDKDMKPFDPKANPDATREALTGDGLYFFKEGEAAPHKLSFNKEHNRLTASTKPLEAPAPTRKPNFFKRLAHSFVTALGFKGFGDCARYNQYEAKKAAFDKITLFNEGKTAFNRVTEERNAVNNDKPERPTPETNLYNKARQYQEKLTGQKNAFDKSDPQHGAHSEYRNLIKATASAMNHIAEMTRDGQIPKLGDNDNNYIARIVSLNLIQQERVSHSNSNEPGPLETKLNELGAEEFVNGINRTNAVAEYKKNVTLNNLTSVIGNHGHDLAKSVINESKPHEKTAPAKELQKVKTAEKTPVMNGPV